MKRLFTFIGLWLAVVCMNMQIYAHSMFIDNLCDRDNKSVRALSEAKSMTVHTLKEQWAIEQVGNDIWIPVYGSLKEAYFLNQVTENDKMLQSQAVFNAAIGVSDVFLIKAAAVGLFKLTAWAGTKIAGQDIYYLAKKQLLTARLSFILSTEAPVEATTFLSKQGNEIIEIVSKEHSRFIKYDVGTGQTLICRYSDDVAKATDLVYDDFHTISINTATSEDDIVRAVVNGVSGGIDDIIDDVEFLSLMKDVKYLPGPQLPQKISNTFENAVYTNRKLSTNERFYKYHGIDNRTGKKYSWFTNKKYTTETELRQNLAIKNNWGVQIEYITEFDVPAGTWVSEGKAASQGVDYRGGGYQAVITNTPNSWIIRTDKAF